MIEAIAKGLAFPYRKESSMPTPKNKLPRPRPLRGNSVYTVASPYILVYASHPDHDEAYRRARARYRS